MKKEVNTTGKTRCLQTIERSCSETLVKNRYQLKNHERKKKQKLFGVTYWRTIERTTIQQSGQRGRSRIYTDTECQPWEDISQDELQTALTLHRKQATESHRALTDAVPNSWLKQLKQHQHLLNAYNHAIDTIYIQKLYMIL